MAVLRRSMFLSGFVWLGLALFVEIPFRVWKAPAGSISTLLIIGDSVTAGLNDDDDTWPRQLSRHNAVTVFDASQPGATLRSARKQNLLLPYTPSVVILEIGGNDLLEGLPIEQFESDLDQLLSDVTDGHRSVVMFELPLPPLHAAYGSAQRRQSIRHHVSLIPKQRFANLISMRGSTVDGIHLSNVGQTRMATMIRSLFGDRIAHGTGLYHRLDGASEPRIDL